MSNDNTQLNLGHDGDVYRAIDKNGIKTQVISIDKGGSGAESLVSDTNPLVGGILSTSNTTVTPLASGDTYTGTFELNTHPDVMVSCQTDNGGMLYFDFSVDGTNYSTFPTAGFLIQSGVHEFHTAVKGPRYFRVRLVNDAGAQTYLRLYTYFGTFNQGNLPLNQTVQTDADARLIRQSNDVLLDISRGVLGGRSIINKFGRNTAVSTTEVVITRTNTTYTGFLTASAQVRVKAGGNANDAAGGTGAQAVTVSGLVNWLPDSETIVTNGTLASVSTTKSFNRVNRVYVSSVGTYGDGVTGGNIGDIDIETAGGVLLARVAANNGQSQTAVYTIPAGKTGYLMNFEADVPGSKSCTVKLFQRQNADDVTTPYSSRRLIHVFSELAGQGVKKFDVYPSLPEKTDIWATAIKDAAGTAAVNATFDIILVDN